MFVIFSNWLKTNFPLVVKIEKYQLTQAEKREIQG